MNNLLKNETVTVSINISKGCNLSCRYCYTYGKNPGDRRLTGFMTADTAQQVCSQFISQKPDAIYFIWFGGEPTLCDPKVVSAALSAQKSAALKNNVTVSNTVQTNGVILSKEWLDLIVEHDIDVGLSLDGPEEIHNSIRKKSNGDGSFYDIMNTVRQLRSNNVSISVLAVATEKTIQNKKKVYDFFRENQLSVNFLPCYDTTASGHIRSRTISPEEFGKFLVYFHARWSDSPDDFTQCPNFNDFHSSYHGEKAVFCSFQNKCELYYSVDVDGNLFPCNCFLGKSRMYMGNLRDNQLSTLLSNESTRQIHHHMSRFPSDCDQCMWLEKCKGGCAACYQQNPTTGKTEYFFCKTRKYVYQYIDGIVNRSLLSTQCSASSRLDNG
jgi:uncharacterized protein